MRTSLLALRMCVPVLALAGSVGGLPAAAFAQAGVPGTALPQESTLSASGTARVSRTPDFVDVVVGVVVHEPTAAAAQSGADKAMSATVTAIKALKLDGADLQTGSVELSPRYERTDRGFDDMKIVGYSATMTLRVRTNDLASVARIIDTALTAGSNRVDSVQFGIKEALEAREEAIRLATRAARRKAEVLADALDMRLGRVVNAGTTSNQWGGWGGANRMSQMSNVMQSGGGAPGEDAVVPGKVEVWADTNVTYVILPK